MDERDLKIYRILREDGRTKVSAIARELGISHPSARERLERLEGKGGEIKVQALLNIRKRGGFVSAVVNLRVRSMDEAEKLADVFARCPQNGLCGNDDRKVQPQPGPCCRELLRP
ncbi:Lrp/AsnC family transcriptional regulator [Thermococcus peptonophilus]|uniref:Lrp/AsnC family transcriptional regulator n=1 Tax=Thermococcus peptonophilus TaxID=53952 RepID=UPI0006D253D1